MFHKRNSKIETIRIILISLAIVLLVTGIINRKKAWGQKVLYFALGMLVMYALTYGPEEITEGYKAALNSR
ncbi:MAG: hypothetical protein V1775_08330 [Bacteroidota bacterium]